MTLPSQRKPRHTDKEVNPLEINLELLQQLPAEEQAEDGLCTLTCTYSCMHTGPIMPCDVTGFIR